MLKKVIDCNCILSRMKKNDQVTLRIVCIASLRSYINLKCFMNFCMEFLQTKFLSIQTIPSKLIK